MSRVVLGLLLALAGCQSGPPPGLEPLPDLSTKVFLPAIRTEIDKALGAAKQNPKDASAAGELGMLLHAHRENVAAEACYRRAVELAPEEFRWRYYLGQVQASRGHGEDAARNLRRALKIDPSYQWAWVKLGNVLLELGRVKEAGEAFERAVADDPDSADALFGLGRIQTAQGDLEAAARSYEKACELVPDYGGAHYALAVTYRRLGRTQEAKPHFRLSEKHKYTVPPLRDPLMKEIRRRDMGAVELIRAAVAVEAEGKVRESLQLHLEALRIDPRLAQVHVNLIALYGKLGDEAKAEHHYRAAMKLNPNMADCHYNFGVLAFNQGRYAEAKAAFEKALEINPFYAVAHNNLGTVLEREGDLKGAERHYRAAVDNDPGLRLAHFHLGRLLTNQTKYSEAIVQFGRALGKEDGQTPRYLYALGATYARSGDRSSALKYLRRAQEAAKKYVQPSLAASIARDMQRLEPAGSGH